MLYVATALSAVAAFAALAVLVLLAGHGRALAALRLLGEQSLAGARSEAETTRAALRTGETSLAERLVSLRGAFDTGTEQIRTVLSREQGELRLAMDDGQQKSAGQVG